MKKKIFLTDDEVNIVMVVTKRLESQGYAVVTCGDGEETLKNVIIEKPDLILLDITLPGMDGYAVCRQLKENAETRHIPVILFSARAQMSDVEAGREHGAEAYIQKPFQPEELLQTIKKLLDTKPKEKA